MLGLDVLVSFAGGLPRDEVRRELAEADLFVLPSVAEATPVALMEAQACGLPVIATRVGAVEEVVEDGRSGWIVPAGDDLALAGALAAALERRDLWTEMGRAGRDHVLESYHLPRLLDQLEEIYRSVAD
jgi:glycosyltransferase involved in cell wall biosynthesis